MSAHLGTSAASVGPIEIKKITSAKIWLQVGSSFENPYGLEPPDTIAEPCSGAHVSLSQSQVDKLAPSWTLAAPQVL